MADGTMTENENRVDFRMNGMELQNLHNTALSIIYNGDRYSRSLVEAALRYLENLLIHATESFSKPIDSKN